MQIFKNLKYKQLKVLIRIVNETNEKRLEVIRQKFKTVSGNFDEASNFLKSLNILRENNELLSLRKDFQIVTIHEKDKDIDGFLKPLLLKELLSVSSPLASTVQPYLNKFKLTHNAFEYLPAAVTNIKESWLRNLFTELGLVEYEEADQTYRINAKWRTLFSATQGQPPLAPSELKKMLDEKEKIGEAAEHAILAYEKKRLEHYPELVKKIEHIAKYDVLAGYDILSWDTSGVSNTPTPRYIEVKAVSSIDSCFHWSRNEVAKAKAVAEKYCLYLLPTKNNNFDIKNLEIIPDPIKNVFNNEATWEKETETYLFTKK